MAKSKAQHRFFQHIVGTDHRLAGMAEAELSLSTIGLPEKIHRPRKRAYAPRPTRRKHDKP